MRQELEKVLNRYSQENGSNTPDFILANYLIHCLVAFDTAVNAREGWCGRTQGWRAPIGAIDPTWKPPSPDDGNLQIAR